MQDRKEYQNKKAKTRNESGLPKGGSCRPQFQKSKGHAPPLLVHLILEIEVSIVVVNHNTPLLDRPNLKVVWHKEVVIILHVENMVDSTLENVVMVRQVASSLVKRVTS